VFYGGALFVILSIYPWNEVSGQGSPFVAMFERMGLREAAGIVNFVVITAALSSCNAGIFSGGRLLYGLSLNGYAPLRMKKLSAAGVPILAILATVSTAIFGAFLNYFVPEKAFIWVTSAVTFIGLLVWVAILVTQLKFRKKLSSYQITQLSYKSCGFPYASYLGLGFIAAVFVMMCFSPETRVGIYVGIPILLLLISVFYLFRLNRIQHSQQEQA
jgi:AAT family amino acid transporter